MFNETISFYKGYMRFCQCLMRKLVCGDFIFSTEPDGEAGYMILVCTEIKD